MIAYATDREISVDRCAEIKSALSLVRTRLIGSISIDGCAEIKSAPIVT